MKVQHGAKWVSSTAGWGANDGAAPWAHCGCRGLCQGIWQLAECLPVRVPLASLTMCSILAPALPISGFLWLPLHSFCAGKLSRSDGWFSDFVFRRTLVVLLLLRVKSGKMAESLIVMVSSSDFSFLCGMTAGGMNGTEPEKQPSLNLLNRAVLRASWLLSSALSFCPLYPLSSEDVVKVFIRNERAFWKSFHYKKFLKVDFMLDPNQILPQITVVLTLPYPCS